MVYPGGTVVRRSAADVELEMAAAETARHEAKENAACELRPARRRKHQEAADAKIAELKAKLHRHKNPAGARS